MTFVWLILLIVFIVYMVVHDKQISASMEYKSANINKQKPPKRLMRKRWWTWMILILLIICFFSSLSIKIDNVDKENKARVAKTNKRKNAVNTKRQKEMLKVLNMWASTNNNFGKVKIEKNNVPTLVLNEQTVASNETKLNRIAIQFSNKVSVQKEMTKAKVRNPKIIAEDGTPIAIWNGSTLELTHKIPKSLKKEKNKQKKIGMSDSQKSMTNELSNTSIVKDYVSKIKYHGDGQADIYVNNSFVLLSKKEKSAVADKINNFVTSYAEDLEIEADPYCFLTFIHSGNLIGHSKQFSHNQYKWK